MMSNFNKSELNFIPDRIFIDYFENRLCHPSCQQLIQQDSPPGSLDLLSLDEPTKTQIWLILFYKYPSETPLLLELTQPSLAPKQLPKILQMYDHEVIKKCVSSHKFLLTKLFRLVHESDCNKMLSHNQYEIFCLLVQNRCYQVLNILFKRFPRCIRDIIDSTDNPSFFQAIESQHHEALYIFSFILTPEQCLSKVLNLQLFYNIINNNLTDSLTYIFDILTVHGMVNSLLEMMRTNHFSWTLIPITLKILKKIVKQLDETDLALMLAAQDYALFQNAMKHGTIELIDSLVTLSIQNTSFLTHLSTPTGIRLLQTLSEQLLEQENTQYLRKLLILRLKSYIHSIDYNLRKPFVIFTAQQTMNRQINHKLAQQLLSKLEDASQSCSAICSEALNLRDAIRKQTPNHSFFNRINSHELNQIIQLGKTI